MKFPISKFSQEYYLRQFEFNHHLGMYKQQWIEVYLSPRKIKPILWSNRSVIEPFNAQTQIKVNAEMFWSARLAPDWLTHVLNSFWLSSQLFGWLTPVTGLSNRLECLGVWLKYEGPVSAPNSWLPVLIIPRNNEVFLYVTWSCKVLEIICAFQKENQTSSTEWNEDEASGFEPNFAFLLEVPF